MSKYITVSALGMTNGLFTHSSNGTGRNGLLYITLKFLHCKRSSVGTGTGTNGLPSHFCTFPSHHEGILYGNLNVPCIWSHPHCQCENFGVIFGPVPGTVQALWMSHKMNDKRIIYFFKMLCRSDRFSIIISNRSMKYWMSPAIFGQLKW